MRPSRSRSASIVQAITCPPACRGPGKGGDGDFRQRSEGGSRAIKHGLEACGELTATCVLHDVAVSSPRGMLSWADGNVMGWLMREHSLLKPPGIMPSILPILV